MLSKKNNRFYLNLFLIPIMGALLVSVWVLSLSTAVADSPPPLAMAEPEPAVTAPNHDVLLSIRQTSAVTQSATFLAEVAEQLGRTADKTRSLAWGDIDGDGDLDLAVGNAYQSANNLGDGSDFPETGQNQIFENVNGALAPIPVWESPDFQNTTSVAWGDVDGDGDLDLAVGNSFGGSSKKNQVFLNQSTNDGIAFVLGWESEELESTNTVSWGDGNGDGWLDLALGNGAGEPNRIYWNTQDSALLRIADDQNDLWESGVDVDTRSLVWGDVDNNGRLDLVAGNRNAENVLYKNDAIIPSMSPITISTHTSATFSIALSDINDDGWLDLAVGNFGHLNQVFINRAESNSDLLNPFTETPVWESPDSQNTTSLAWGDFDNDGDQDLAISNQDEPNQIFENREGGLDSAPIWDSRDSLRSFVVAWVDIDNDGTLDLSIGNDGAQSASNIAGEINQLYRNGNVLFELVADWTDLNGIPDLIDFDNDGYLELVVVNGSSITIFPHSELGSYDNPAVVPLTSTSLLMDTAWGDIDNNGWLDLVLGYFDGPAQIFFNESGTFTNPINLSDQFAGTQSIELGDIDNDGFLDLVIGNSEQPNQLFRYVPDIRAFTLAWSSSDEQWTRSIDLGDINGDGYLDLAVGNGATTEGNLSPNQIFLNARGVFADQPIWENFESIGTESVTLGDINGDGFLDLAVGNVGLRDLNPGANNQIFVNIGGTLDETPIWESSGNDRKNTEDVILSDVDGDGDLDLLVANGAGKEKDPDNPRLYLNEPDQIFENIDGAFAQTPLWQTNQQSSNLTEKIAIGDIDKDGDIDIIWGSSNQDAQLLQNLLHITPTSGVVIKQPPSQLLQTTTIPISYTLYNDINSNFGEVIGIYSIDGGGTWARAIPASETNHLKFSATPEGQAHVFTWDVLASGLVGQSADVIFSLIAYPQPQLDSQTITATYLYTSTAFYPSPSLYIASTAPFRVQGTQVQIRTEDGNVAPNAYVYQKPVGETRGVIIGNYATGEVYQTGAQGILNGRSPILHGDGLYATLPITQTYHVPPQLFFSSADSYLSLPNPQISFANTSFTAEFWTMPLSPDGDLFALGEDLKVSYSTSGALGEQQNRIHIVTKELSVTVPVDGLTDGDMHQFALSHDPSLTANNVQVYLDGVAVLTDTTTITNNSVGEANENQGFQFGSEFIGAIDEIRLWNAIRTPDDIAESQESYQRQLTAFWETPYGELGALLPDTQDLIGYWPIGEVEDRRVANLALPNQWGEIVGNAAIAFKPHYTAYHTSGTVSETLAFQPVTAGGIIPITVTADNPLILFDIDVSLEWDTLDDPNFMPELQLSFERASELLYDVTNGQAALRQVNLYDNKAFWGQADAVIFANNSLRPSAAIGGVVYRPISETVFVGSALTATKTITDAYLPGQIRMGTVWDPFGENTADLGEEWSRALAHELAHYLFFLPDNYLGYKVDKVTGNKSILGLVDCQNSFMTNNIDPRYSEFLIRNQWIDACEDTLANRTTGRSDWDTITKFYPFLNEPTLTSATHHSHTTTGPEVLPLDLVNLIGWEIGRSESVLDTRNFTIRDALSQERIRLPNAQVYLIKQVCSTIEGCDDELTNDLIIPLGSPTGGGDRIKVRGATAGDQLCLFGNDPQQRYSTCAEVTATAASLAVRGYTDSWNPSVSVETHDGQQLTVEVELDTDIADGNMLYVQVYPQHYMAFDGLAPVVTWQPAESSTYTATVVLPLPAYEISVRVWEAGVDEPHSNNGREAVTSLRLSPEEWASFSVPLTLTLESLGLSDIAGPVIRPTGGPVIRPTGGPVIRPTGGPVIRPTGGPVIRPTGGPVIRPTGGPVIRPTGGPVIRPTGGPVIRPTGGPVIRPTGGAGDDDMTNNRISRGQTSFAPILSADAQVVVYNALGFFEDNGVINLQTLATIPEQRPWLVPIGQAYLVESRDDFTDPRYISFNYLQRDVPAGYEHTLAVYFLDCADVSACDGTWEPISGNPPLVENIVVAELQINEEDQTGKDGLYAVMASIPLPDLQPGWNAFSFPLPVTRSITSTLASLIDDQGQPLWRAEDVYRQRVDENSKEFVAPVIDYIRVRSGPGANNPIVGWLTDNSASAVIGRENGWIQIHCPPYLHDAPEACWIAELPFFVSTYPFNVYRPIGTSPLTHFEPNHVYWLKIDPSIEASKIPTFYIAPPVRLSDGTLGNP